MIHQMARLQKRFEMIDFVLNSQLAHRELQMVNNYHQTKSCNPSWRFDVL